MKHRTRTPFETPMCFIIFIYFTFYITIITIHRADQPKALTHPSRTKHREPVRVFPRSGRILQIVILQQGSAEFLHFDKGSFDAISMRRM
jgi:hypothetical protein